MTLLLRRSIPVRIQPVVWLMALFIGWINGNSPITVCIWAVVAVVSILIHEYGHALTAVTFGQRATIELTLFGGVTRHHGGRLRRWQDFIIIFNGPLAGMLLAAAAYVIYAQWGSELPVLATYALRATWIINIFWTIVNLLPIHPLDGGQMLTLILQGLFGHTGYRLALFIGVLTGGAVALFFFAQQALLAGALILMLTFESYRSWSDSRQMSNIDHNAAYQQQFKHAVGLIQDGNLTEGQQQLQQLINITGQGIIHTHAAAYLSDLYMKQGRYQAAYQLLQPLASQSHELILPQFIQAAYHCGDWQAIITYGANAYQQQPGYALALINAQAQAQLEHSVAAVGWLHRAQQDGAPELVQALARPEFNLIRTTASFQSFSHTLKR
jgi:stage IV sporulation protein FB